MTPEIFEAARPYLILVSSGRVNLNAAPEAVLYSLPGMTPAAVTEILQLRDAGTLPDDRESLLDLLSSTASRPLRDAGREFSGRVSFRTDEVEIISTGRVEGSPVESRVRVIVARADFGAAVVSREFD